MLYSLWNGNMSRTCVVTIVIGYEIQWPWRRWMCVSRLIWTDKSDHRILLSIIVPYIFNREYKVNSYWALKLANWTNKLWFHRIKGMGRGGETHFFRSDWKLILLTHYSNGGCRVPSERSIPWKWQVTLIEVLVNCAATSGYGYTHETPRGWPCWREPITHRDESVYVWGIHQVALISSEVYQAF